jgi:uncharacterized Zn-finger protein
MQPIETIYVDTAVVACNGDGGPLGHPRVYLNLGPGGKIECPYCSRLFVKRDHHAPGGAPAVDHPAPGAPPSPHP